MPRPIVNAKIHVKTHHQPRPTAAEIDEPLLLRLLNHRHCQDPRQTATGPPCFTPPLSVPPLRRRQALVPHISQ
nr:hypothetical protein CFP56_74157 [Quercus suber]